ncbi:MAG: DUF2809 domain-containing protein [Bacteroidetes bacterium]|nr:DUF2809 domain-containing protein [Bacteroidota bacterium]
MFILYKPYFRWACAVLTMEILIAVYLHDALIRPYGGDFLVVILLYCLVKSFWNANPIKAAGAVLLFACTAEVSQYFHLVRLLGLQGSYTAKLLLGTSFSFTDILAYVSGIALVIAIESIRSGPKSSLNN